MCFDLREQLTTHQIHHDVETLQAWLWRRTSSQEMVFLHHVDSFFLMASAQVEYEAPISGVGESGWLQALKLGLGANKVACAPMKIEANLSKVACATAHQILQIVKYCHVA